MLRGHRVKPHKEHDQEATEELIGLLNAISIVSKRLARNLTLLRVIERERGEANASAKHAYADQSHAV